MTFKMLIFTPNYKNKLTNMCSLLKIRAFSIVESKFAPVNR